MIDIAFKAPVRTAALAAAAALAVAYISQYGFGLHPCEMCYWQRIPYGILLGIGALTFFAGVPKRPLHLLALLTAVTETGLAVLHAGVEKKWWEGPTACSAGFNASSAEELLKQIMAAPVVRCDQPAFDVFGVTFAGANVLFAFALTVFLVIAWRRG